MTLITQRGFTGHVQLDAVGLIHMRGRCYDPMLGRFITPDPFVQAPYDSQSLNRYSYCMNNPLSYVDPSGFWSWRKFLHSVVTGVAAAAGFIIGVVTGQPAIICNVMAGMLAGGTAGYIGGGTRGILPGMVMGAAAGFIGGTISIGASQFMNPAYASMFTTGAQIGYTYHRDGWDALGYMAGGMIGQGLVMGVNYAYNMRNGSNAKDTTGSINGQYAPVDGDNTYRLEQVGFKEWAQKENQDRIGTMRLDNETGNLDVNGNRFATTSRSLPNNEYNVVKGDIWFFGHQYNPLLHSSIQLVRFGVAAFGVGQYTLLDFQGGPCGGGYFAGPDYSINGPMITRSPWDTTWIEPKPLVGM